MATACIGCDAVITRVLIANRSEIASRIIRTCRRLGVGTVAVFSDADTYAPYVREADTAWPLPGNSPTDTYLRGELLIAAALARGCDAIHPGYGFLSENAAFAQSVVDAGLTWIGPPPAAITAMGSKIEAKRLMRAAGVPVLPDTTVESLQEIGLPALVKASAGGGGRGMRIVRDAATLDDAVAGGQREAAAAFGDGTVFVERFVEGGRHIEIQVFADLHGNVVSLFERDCTVQRRHQKIIEESPSPAVDDELARGHERCGHRCSPRRRLRRGRHRRVPRRRRGQLLVPGDEHAPAGRTPGHRDDHRPRPRRAAAGDRRRRTASAGRAAPHDQRTRHRGPALRRRSRERLPAQLRNVPTGRVPRDRGRANRQRRRQRLGGEPVLRLDDRQGHCPCADAGRGDQQAAARPRKRALDRPDHQSLPAARPASAARRRMAADRHRLARPKSAGGNRRRTRRSSPPRRWRGSRRNERR